MSGLGQMTSRFSGTNLNIAYLVSEFDKLIRESKARELGLSPDEVVSDVLAGRRVYLPRRKQARRIKKQREVVSRYREEQRQREQEEEFTEDRPRIQRAIRGGENSIVAEMQHRLEDCERLGGLVAEFGGIGDTEKQALKSNLAQSANNAIRSGRELLEIEANIELKKGTNPLFGFRDAMRQQAATAQESPEQKEATRSPSSSTPQPGQQKSTSDDLSADIQNALQNRDRLLHEQLNLMQTQMDLCLRWGQALRTAARSVRTGNIGTDLLNKINQTCEVVGKQIDNIRGFEFQQTAQDLDETKDVQLDNRILNREISELRGAIDGIAAPLDRLENLLDEVKTGRESGENR